MVLHRLHWKKSGGRLLKIGLVYDAIFPYVKGGGERIFYDLSKHLCRYHEVHLFGMKYWDGPSILQPQPGIYIHGVCKAMPFYTDDDISRRSLREAILFSLSVFFALLKSPKFDIIDCMSTPYIPLFAAALAAKIRRTPIVSSWLEIWSRDHWEKYVRNRFLAAMGAQLERRATHIPVHILANSPHTAKGLRAHEVNPLKITVLTPWIDTEEINSCTPDPDQTCDIIFIGRLIPSKRVDLLINALDRLRGRGLKLRCNIIGKGPEEFRLKSLIAELGLEDRTVFLGWVESVIPFLKASKILALLSEREGFGMVVVEAAACGVPTVTLDAPNNAAKDLIKDAQFGIISSDDLQAVADAIQQLLDIPQPIARTNSKQLRRWAAQYDMRRILVRYEQAYLKVIRDNNA